MRGRLGAYREMRDNMSEGLRFYMSLQEAIATLHQQAGDYVLTRRLQQWAFLSRSLLVSSQTSCCPPGPDMDVQNNIRIAVT